MLKQAIFGLGISVLASFTLTGDALAQSSDASSMTAEELEQVFKKQKTRGLVLAPTTSTGNAAAEATEATTSVTTTATAAATDATATETYVELAPEEQVNIQISFDFDSSALRSDQKPKLATLCQVMQSGAIEVFRIVGHTDSSGSASYNERLSRLRAQEVKRHLVSDCGISETRLEAVGVGEAFPINKNDPRADQNRRVEFQALS